VNALRFLFGSLCAAAVSSGQVSPPSILYKDVPQYSEEARIARYEGTVLLTVVVDMNGKPRDIKILRALGLGLDEKAITSVNQWRFKPGTKGGIPVPVFAQIEVNFRMGDNDGAVHWHLARVGFDLPNFATRPGIVKVESPHIADAASGAATTLTFDIDGTGTPANIQIEKATDEGWASDVTEALRKWKFSPGSKDGSPITVPCTMEFVRGNETTPSR